MSELDVAATAAMPSLDPNIRYVTRPLRGDYEARAGKTLAVAHVGGEIRVQDRATGVAASGPSYLDALRAYEREAARFRDDLS